MTIMSSSFAWRITSNIPIPMFPAKYVFLLFFWNICPTKVVVVVLPIVAVLAIKFLGLFIL